MTAHLIIDAHNLLFRCGHTTGHLTLADGTPCGAAYGFLRALFASYRAEIGATGGKVHVVWDGGRSVRRLAILPEYKGNRVARGELTPAEEMRKAEREAILSQLPMISGLLDLLGVRQYRRRGVEADDIIAAIVTTYASPSEPIAVLSSDEDFKQLVRPGVFIVSPNGDRWHSENIPHAYDEVLKKALTGCKSDNVPGLVGVGAVTAEKFISWVREMYTADSTINLTDLMRCDVLPRSPAKGRAKTCLNAFKASPETVKRNVSLVDLSIALDWEEVWQAATQSWKCVPDMEQFTAEVYRMAWHSMKEYLETARKISEQKPI